MAIGKSAARFLIEARSSGVSFERTLTIGRQSLATSPLWLARQLATRGFIEPAQQWHWARTVSRRPYVADPFLRALGALELDELDNSDYEGASIVHDLNRPAPDRWQQTFDAVIDGGSLEHVFEFTTALRSLMGMVKVGGHLLITTPTNNMCGHGFYQFSPELFYRALGTENGYRVERLLVLEDDHAAGRALNVLPYLLERAGPRYSVVDAARTPTSQMEFTSRRPTMLLLQARRITDAPPLAESPQQSRFSVHWESEASSRRRDAARRQPRPRRSPALGALTALGFHLILGGAGRGPRPVRRFLLWRAARRRALERQPDALRKLG